MKYKEINQQRLVKLFEDAYESEGIRLCFLLGAGASVSSGIPTGATLAKEWYDEIEDMLDPAELRKWIKEKKIDTKNLAESYPAIYEQRFYCNHTAGYESLQRTMSRAEPSLGYLILAKILADTRHSFIITTNFDYLVEDALFLTSNKRPLVCGHEILANFIHAQSSRPTIIKVHRDLMLEPFNHTNNTGKLEKAWIETLKPIVKGFHLVVLGYGGNDGSLMNYLQGLPKDERQSIYWCCRDKNKISDKTKSLLTGKDFLVTINGFDELMYSLNDVSKFRNFIHELKDDETSILVKNAREKTKLYQKKIDELAKQAEEDIKSGHQPDQSMQTILPDWWIDFQSKINASDDVEEQEKLYKEGLKKLPDSVPLTGNYALFLHETRKDYDRAERYYKKVLEIDPDNVNANGNYASFLSDIRKDYDQAERHYKKALEIDSDQVNLNGNYANLLRKRKYYDQAEQYYKKTLKIDPDDVIGNSNYVGFLLAQGRSKEGKALLSRTFNLTNDENQDSLLEQWFYTLAHIPARADQARKEIKKLLAQGVRSVGWDFSANIEQAENEGCQYVAELQALAEKITNE